MLLGCWVLVCECVCLCGVWWVIWVLGVCVFWMWSKAGAVVVLLSRSYTNNHVCLPPPKKKTYRATEEEEED
jgi:hypothetical protein